jgi:hypothetical protein
VQRSEDAQFVEFGFVAFELPQSFFFFLPPPNGLFSLVMMPLLTTTVLFFLFYLADFLLYVS